MKFGNIVRVEISRYLTKITTLQRKADHKSARSKVLAAKHTASLQLLCTVGGDLASSRTVAKIIFCQRKYCEVSTHTIFPNFIDLSAETVLSSRFGGHKGGVAKGEKGEKRKRTSSI